MKKVKEITEKISFSPEARWLCASREPWVDTLPNTAGWGTVGSYELVNEDRDEDRAYLHVRDFSLDRLPEKAELVICALGYYEAYLNGKKLGDGVLAPGFTVYNKRGLAHRFDLTALLQKENRLTVLMGNGFYNQSTPDTFGFHNAPWRAKCRFKCEMTFRYPEGEEKITSGPGFRMHPSFITYQNIRSGETFDMREKQYSGEYMGPVDGWEASADVNEYCGFSLENVTLETMPPIRKCGMVAPCGVGGDENRCVIKFPVNMAGWIRIRLKGERGREAVLSFVERDPFMWHAPDLKPEHINQFHVHKEFQTWRIILSGEEDVCEPHFTYYGFQYVIVTGLGYVPDPGDVTGIFVHTDLMPLLKFECSEPIFNRLHALAPRTFLNNYHSIPTDCPHREKNGYTGDGWIACEYAMYNFDMREAYKKFLLDIADDRQPDGNMSGIVPNCNWETCNRRVFDILWSGGGIMIMKHYHDFYGDTDLLEYMWEHLEAYMDYVDARTKDCLSDVAFLGDWLEPGADFGVRRTDPPLTNGVLYTAYNRIMAGFARILGRDEDKWLRRAETAREAVCRKYFASEEALSESSQTALAVALELDILPQEFRKTAEKALVGALEKEGMHIATGLLGTRYIFDALLHAGRGDLAADMLRQTDFPSFGYMLKNGATTIWESWEGHISLDHPMMGSYDAFLVKNIGGIRYSFREAVITVPDKNAGVEWASTEFASPKGLIKVKWRYEGDRVRLSLLIPGGVSCRVLRGGKEYLPSPGENDFLLE
ncbi:MAG: family 78 glycoside hydrolase catalytic domain [Abditibacteriota bacterium]|nr:family 78 glycoside hydrolase catalytic domain [Abditibacteriota bacterium]